MFLPAFLFPGETLCSDAEELPAGAFLIDMTPLLSTNGRIAAIAPDCRAVTGYIGRSPFIWSRDFGMIRLNAGSGLFGIGLRLSDDGHVMAGIFRSDTRKEIDMGFIWNYDGEVQFMHDLGILKVSWNGLSADGKVAVGHGFSVRQETDFLWSVSDGKRLREISHTISNCDMSPSRDGNKILLENDDRSVVIVDLENGERRELKFGGVSASAVDGAHNCLRAGDPNDGGSCRLPRRARSGCWPLPAGWEPCPGRHHAVIHTVPARALCPMGCRPSGQGQERISSASSGPEAMPVSCRVRGDVRS